MPEYFFPAPKHMAPRQICLLCELTRRGVPYVCIWDAELFLLCQCSCHSQDTSGKCCFPMHIVVVFYYFCQMFFRFSWQVFCIISDFEEKAPYLTWRVQRFPSIETVTGSFKSVFDLDWHSFCDRCVEKWRCSITFNQLFCLSWKRLNCNLASKSGLTVSFP